MAFTETFAPFFADFGVNATIGALTVPGIFDAIPAEQFGVLGVSPSFTYEFALAPSVARGSSLTIGGTSYTVQEIRKDGTGLAMLDLEKA
jgi:hypothetical protein